MRRSRWALAVLAAMAGCGGSITENSSSAGGGAACPTGSEGCACYANNTCDVGFTCASQRCLSPVTSSVGGRSVGTTPVAGGSIGVGANPATGTGGAPITIWTGGTPGTGATGAQPSGFQILTAGYVVSGAWHGYAWTAAVTSAAAVAGGTTTITPADFSAVPAGATELCAAGNVGPATDYGGVALLGINVNQLPAIDGGIPVVSTIAIGGTGVIVRYTNLLGSVLRVQIQTPLGETSPTGRWCAILSGAGGTEMVTWDMFWGGVSDTTQGCWNSGGNHPPIGTQISNVALLVPGGNASAVPYRFCLQGFAQAS
jgi:hypothetical protein